MDIEDGVADERGSVNQVDEEDVQIRVSSSKQQSPENGQNDTDHTRNHKKTDVEVKLRRLLRFHRYAPIKIKGGKAHFHVVYCIIMLMQAVKIALLTAQMVKFASDRATFSSVVNRGHLTLRHLLLNKWDSGLETPPYPPAHGDFAVYKIESLIQDLNYAVEGYYNAENNAIGFYILTNRSGTIDKMSGRMKHFDFTGFHRHNDYQGISVQETEFSVGDIGLTYHFDPSTNKTTYKYNITETFEYLNLTEPVKRLLSINLDFSLHSVRVYEDLKKALCLHIEGTVKFEDDDNNGQMLVDLDTSSRRISCSQIYQNDFVPDVDLTTGYRPLGIAVLVFCGISLLISILSLAFGLFVRHKTKRYMQDHFREFYQVVSTDDAKDLKSHEYMKLWVVLIWDIFVIISDVFSVVGVSNIAFGSWATHKNRLLSVFDTTAVFLSIGGLLSWFYILKILKLQDNFQVLFKTLYGAFSAMLSYLFCIGVLFTGFFLCGFVVLGPYHVKFETASATIETLFSIVNGDEIFATLANVEYNKTGNNKFVWWFSRIYICLFVAVFTIVVLNILIAIFVNAYDAIKEEQELKKEKRRFGPLEKALYKLFTKSGKSSSSRLRSTFYDLIRDDKAFSMEESQVQTELRKLWRMTSDDGSMKLLKLKDRTLRAFIDEGNDGSKCTCCHNNIVVYFRLSDFD